MSKLIPIVIFFIAIGLITSCRTTEKNYRTAYEIAKAKKDKDNDPQVDKLIEEEKYGEQSVINGDSIHIKTEYVMIVEDTIKNVPKYGVAVGYFKQIFNARMFKKRLKSNSYPAYILKDRLDQYYVVAKGFDELDNAVLYAKYIREKGNIPLPIEPFIIIKAY